MVARAGSSPEDYAPPDRRPPGKPSDAEIIALLHRQRDIDPANSATENLSVLIQRVSGQSMEEIDRVIRELENVRDMLRNEGERVVREIAGYARLSHSLMSATKMIADNVKQWKQPGS
jgi:CBS-domain-containing membrane protein